MSLLVTIFRDFQEIEEIRVRVISRKVIFVHDSGVGLPIPANATNQPVGCNTPNHPHPTHYENEFTRPHGHISGSWR